MRGIAALFLASMHTAGVAGAVADDSDRWFVIARAGQSEFDVPLRDGPGFFGRVDDQESAWGLGGGYRFEDWLAVRFDHLRVDGFRGGVDCPQGVVCPEIAIREPVDAASWSVAVEPAIRVIGNLRLYGLVGAQYLELDGGLLRDYDDVDWQLGAGAEYDLSRHLGLGLEFNASPADTRSLLATVRFSF